MRCTLISHFVDQKSLDMSISIYNCVIYICVCLDLICLDMLDGHKLT